MISNDLIVYISSAVKSSSTDVPVRSNKRTTVYMPRNETATSCEKLWSSNSKKMRTVLANEKLKKFS